MLLPKQVWKDIKGYEGLYQVSNTGKARSMNYRNTGNVRRLKPSVNKDGYLQVGLYKEGKYYRYLVHRLVALTFIPNPNNLPQVNHKDENKANNTVWNLEWCDAKYNSNYGTRIERCSKALTGKQLSEETKAKISETLKGKKLNEEHKAKISEAMKGQNNPNYGKHRTEETKQKMSITLRKPIIMLDMDNNIIACFKCVGDANEYIGKDRGYISSIYNCAQGSSNTAYGYKWKYIQIIPL